MILSLGNVQRVGCPKYIQFHVSPFRYSMCRRFSYMCVAVLVCRRFDQLPVDIVDSLFPDDMCI